MFPVSFWGPHCRVKKQLVGCTQYNAKYLVILWCNTECIQHHAAYIGHNFVEMSRTIVSPKASARSAVESAFVQEAADSTISRATSQGHVTKWQLQPSLQNWINSKQFTLHTGPIDNERWQQVQTHPKLADWIAATKLHMLQHCFAERPTITCTAAS